MLAGPTGLWAIVTSSASGKITYDADKKRFRQKGGNFYFRLFGQDSIGRPESDAEITITDLKKALIKTGIPVELPEPKPILVFTNPKAEVDAADSPLPALSIEKLKDFVRKQPKETPDNIVAIREMQKILPSESDME